MSDNQENITTEIIPETEVTEQEETLQEETPKPVQETSEDLNFKAMREAKRQAERERDELHNKIKALEAAKLNARVDNTSVDNTRVDNTDDNTIYDDEDEEVKLRRDVNELKRFREAEHAEKVSQNIVQQLNQNFPDLNEVISVDNVETLKARDKNFAKLVSQTPTDATELYNRAISAYTLIKKYNIYKGPEINVKDTRVKDDHAQDRDRVDKNISKPRPASTVATSKPSEGLSEFAAFAGLNEEDRRKAIYKIARERANM